MAPEHLAKGFERANAKPSSERYPQTKGRLMATRDTTTEPSYWVIFAGVMMILLGF